MSKFIAHLVLSFIAICGITTMSSLHAEIERDGVVFAIDPNPSYRVEFRKFTSPRQAVLLSFSVFKADYNDEYTAPGFYNYRRYDGSAYSLGIGFRNYGSGSLNHMFIEQELIYSKSSYKYEQQLINELQSQDTIYKGVSEQQLAQARMNFGGEYQVSSNFGIEAKTGISIELIEVEDNDNFGKRSTVRKQVRLREFGVSMTYRF